MVRNDRDLRFCLVTDRDLANGRSISEVVRAAARGGVTMVQFRDKTATTRNMIEEAATLLAILKPLGIPLLVNDRVDVALAIDADGVHVGQDDMPVATVRSLIGPDKILGLSITCLRDLAHPHGEADYLGVGPVFAQTTKRDARAPLGIDGLARVRRRTDTPVMAIGGINAGNVRDVMATRIAGVAIVSAIMAAENPEEATRRVGDVIA